MAAGPNVNLRLRMAAGPDVNLRLCMAARPKARAASAGYISLPPPDPLLVYFSANPPHTPAPLLSSARLPHIVRATPFSEGKARLRALRPSPL
eukprot:1191677-Prorocentrum_minimum.AAC.2